MNEIGALIDESVVKKRQNEDINATKQNKSAKEKKLAQVVGKGILLQLFVESDLRTAKKTKSRVLNFPMSSLKLQMNWLFLQKHQVIRR